MKTSLDLKENFGRDRKQYGSVMEKSFLVPLEQEVLRSGGIKIIGKFIVKIPARVVKREGSLDEIFKRKFDIRNFISHCFRCNAYAQVYTGSEPRGEELVLKWFACANCGKTDYEPVD